MYRLFPFIMACVLSMSGYAETETTREFTPRNPVSPEWLAEHLRKDRPRLVLTADLLEEIREGVLSGGPVALVYAKLQEQADVLLEEPPLDRTFEGRRMLSVSRDALGRTTILALAYLVEGNPAYLQRLESELQSVCRFDDWNPSHFLDAAEMATAVALALDWCGDSLSKETRNLARDALREKALLPSLIDDKNKTWWIDSRHNWNLVCHGGLAIAALAVFEDDPELACRILHRSLEKAPLGMEPYAPDGAYVEGPMYWFYATDFLTLTLSCYRTALGTDFGLTEAPGFRQSVLFSLLAAGPSGDYYNYFDSGTRGFLDFDHLGLLAWFASKVKPSLSVIISERLASALELEDVPIDRFSAIYLMNFAGLPDAPQSAPLPTTFLARGAAPVGILRPEKDAGLYLATKGGSASDNHGNMDAGSFILEWRKIRWSVDPGNQNYTALEKAIGTKALWDAGQDSPRWDLITKNNFGHSTLTVNGEKHLAEARALVVDADLDAGSPFMTLDLTPLYDGNVEDAKRTFRRLSEDTVRIEDVILTNGKTASLCWQMITVADVEVLGEGAILRQGGEAFRLVVHSPSDFEVRVVQLSPPPLPHDLDLPGLKRIELRVTPENLTDANGRIIVELSGSG